MSTCYKTDILQDIRRLLGLSANLFQNISSVNWKHGRDPLHTPEMCSCSESDIFESHKKHLAGEGGTKTEHH